MEVGKSQLVRLIVGVLVLTLSVEALKCYDGSQDWGKTEVTCDPSNKFCVLWADYSFDDYYAFCDDSNLCQSVGFTNNTYYGITCCDKDDCNPIPPRASTVNPPVSSQPTGSQQPGNSSPYPSGSQQPGVGGTTSNPSQGSIRVW